MLDFEGFGRFCKIYLGRFGLIITIYILNISGLLRIWNGTTAKSLVVESKNLNLGKLYDSMIFGTSFVI